MKEERQKLTKELKPGITNIRKAEAQGFRKRKNMSEKL